MAFYNGAWLAGNASGSSMEVSRGIPTAHPTYSGLLEYQLFLFIQIQILYSTLLLSYSMQVTIVTAGFITDGDFLFFQWQHCLTFSLCFTIIICKHCLFVPHFCTPSTHSYHTFTVVVGHRSDPVNIRWSIHLYVFFQCFNLRNLPIIPIEIVSYLYHFFSFVHFINENGYSFIVLVSLRT